MTNPVENESVEAEKPNRITRIGWWVAGLAAAVGIVLYFLRNS